MPGKEEKTVSQMREKDANVYWRRDCIKHDHRLYLANGFELYVHFLNLYSISNGTKKKFFLQKEKIVVTFTLKESEKKKKKLLLLLH